MTLWDIFQSSSQFVGTLFSQKSDFTSSILSDTSFVIITSMYYKLQYFADSFSYTLCLALNSILFSVSTTTLNALTIALKFLVLIALLIFIRGGIPRYRFDHLTKIGWIKYLSLVLASILMQFLLLWMC